MDELRADHLQSAEMWLEAFEGMERTPDPWEGLLAAIAHSLLALAAVDDG